MVNIQDSLLLLNYLPISFFTIVKGLDMLDWSQLINRDSIAHVTILTRFRVIVNWITDCYNSVEITELEVFVDYWFK